MKKCCTKCKVVYDSVFFDKHTVGLPYLRSWCKNCNSNAQRYKERAGYFKTYNKNYKQKKENLIKLNARKAVVSAIRKKIIKRVDKCSNCGSSANIEAHHEDYTKPLEIIWLCKKCHYIADLKLIKSNNN